ncbi:MAG TPA: SBBP repeat-containing protein [Polyangiaceae bacterium]|nr:SBBP repeat-containing protein [Polyangiaceae bacterium]
MTSLRALARVFLAVVCVLFADGEPGGAAKTTPTPGVGSEKPAEALATVTARMTKLPLRFEANAGQWDPRVRFVARQGGATLFLTDEGMTIGLRDVKASPRTAGMSPEEERAARDEALAEAKTAAVTLKIVGAKPAAPKGEEQLITKSNFFLGNDATKWRTNVPNYGQVRAKGWVPGVEVLWHGGESGLEYDLEVAAGVDARGLTFEIEGADRIDVAEDGSLEIATAAGVLAQRPPKVVQDGRELRTRYVLRGAKRVAFAVDDYDGTRALLIDPVFTYSTYLGGSGAEAGNGAGIAVDSAGSAYVTGQTTSTDFPTAGAYQTTGASSAFVTKLNASGNALVYSTYLGTNSYGKGIAVDASGNAYVTGYTNGTIPTVNAFQGSSGVGAYAAFVTKLSATGSALTYSTYLGGSGDNEARGIAVDGSGNAYVTGSTNATDFPVGGGYRLYNSGSYDAFVTKFTAAGVVTYSGYLGGSNPDYGYGIAVDGSGNAYVVGWTSSTNFPTASAYKGTLSGGTDTFVTKLNASGSALVYSTYLGGSAQDSGEGIAVDGSGSAYVAGFTYSTNFPTAGPFQATLSGTSDAFVTKLGAAGSALTYSTYLGGNGGDGAGGIAVDATGSAYVTGNTSSTNFPTASAYQGTNAGGNSDAFVIRLSAAGSALTYSTYLGGSGDDLGFGIAVDGAGGAYVAGSTTSANFPTASAYQNANAGGASDAFVTKIADPELTAGKPCASAGACAAGLSCTDGVCCNTSCTDQCAACDVSGHMGTCTPVTGAPHGSRTACVGTGTCASTCDGTVTNACAFPPSTTVCGSTCTSSVETDSYCDGKGSCLVGSAHSCNNLVCTSDGSKCKTTCTVDADCVTGLSCVGGACTTIVTATCIDDHTAQPPTGPSQDCTPYACKNGCKTSCVSVDDCVAPNVCSPAGQCVAPPSSGGSSGCSCNASSDGSAPWTTALLAVAVASILTRRRRVRDRLAPPPSPPLR